MPYVLAVAVNQRVIATVQGRIAQFVPMKLAAMLPGQAWKKISAGAGAKGPRVYHWARAAIRPQQDSASYWLLVRRSLTDPTDRAYYLCYGPEHTPLRELVRVAGARWAIEETFQSAKGQVGLDQYQVRRYDSWYRRITLVMLAAHAFLTVTTAHASQAADPKRGRPAASKTSVPLTLPEARGLLAHLIWNQPPDATSVLHWSHWRRRHQARARRCHYTARGVPP